MAVVRNAWVATATYAIGDLVNYNGVVYRALAAITGNANNENPCQDTTRWIVEYVIRAEDSNGVMEAVKQELNVDDDIINNSIPFYLQLAEQTINARIRPPTNVVSDIVSLTNITVPTGYTDRQYIRVPSDLLQVENIRAISDGSSTTGILGVGNLEIKAAATDYDFELLRSYYDGNDYFFGERSLTNFSSPLYRKVTIAGITYFEIAPSQFESNTQFEIRYYAAEPMLNETRNVVNAQGNPINSAGQTIDQWIADGNARNAFVQDTTVIERNWYTANRPNLLVYGTLAKASAYLKDDERAAIWKNEFEQAILETIDFIYRFEEVRPTDLQMGSVYSI